MPQFLWISTNSLYRARDELSQMSDEGASRQQLAQPEYGLMAPEPIELLRTAEWNTEWAIKEGGSW